MTEGENKSDIWLCGGTVVNLFTMTLEDKDVLISDGEIQGLYDRQEREALQTEVQEIIELQGAYLAPGLIDGHMHIESTMVTPAALAQVIVPRGTTSIIADPHEIANVLGLPAIVGLSAMTKQLPLDIFFMIPSCVPATPLETAGAELQVEDIQWLFEHLPQAIGLAEVMNYPAVIAKEPSIMAKIEEAKRRNLPIDGHAPALSGDDLQRYISAGISTDHECVTAQEGWEKLKRGIHLLIREGSAAKNLTQLASCLTTESADRISFCTDDRHPEDLLVEGHLDHLLRQAVKVGIDPLLALKACSWTTARHYGLSRRGAIAPGYLADLVVFEDLENFQASLVIKKGTVVARKGLLVEERGDPSIDPIFTNTVRLPDIKGKLVPSIDSRKFVRVIGLQKNQITTSYEEAKAKDIGPAQDLLYAAVIERHGKKGSIGQAIVRGLGLQKGALASTIAHDSHNLIVIGTSAEDMEKACQAVAETGGGIAVVVDGELQARLPLPIAGLMSTATVEEVAVELKKIHQVLWEAGCTISSPVMTLSFLALPVIPELKITDQGLVDVRTFQFLSLEV
ncbi:adenine deaminase [Heliorestis acidaminivorans]|uniref:Adenine deaminase n=1 Tax=Heliorestis acidaminivorans TaxID=553427 RepID=A0A6I0EWZ0_9FIRM|nr:adenine deaminase [Heliorestis acidaminivorans]KAB2952677.1 adenine deaminase [Heliorestis acidaminivorans]